MEFRSPQLHLIGKVKEARSFPGEVPRQTHEDRIAVRHNWVQVWGKLEIGQWQEQNRNFWQPVCRRLQLLLTTFRLTFRRRGPERMASSGSGGMECRQWWQTCSYGIWYHGLPIYLWRTCAIDTLLETEGNLVWQFCGSSFLAAAQVSYGELTKSLWSENLHYGKDHCRTEGAHKRLSLAWCHH